MTHPPYIDYGVVISTPPPVVSKQGKLLTLVLDGDAARLDALVERVLNAPSSSAVYRAVGNTVILQIGEIGEIRSGPPYDAAGSARETQASLWIPVVAGYEGAMGTFVAQRFGIFCPYIFVDNPMSLVGGREVFGYPKSGGRFTPADGLGDDVSVRVFGGDFGPTSKALWRPLLQVQRDVVNAGPPGAVLSGMKELAAAIMPKLSDLPKIDLIFPTPAALKKAGEDLAKNTTSQVFLKQFRDVQDGTLACYQEVVEVPVVMDSVDAQATGSPWTVTVSPLQSHPITQELGLATQTTTRAFRMNLDFTVAPGATVP